MQKEIKRLPRLIMQISRKMSRLNNRISLSVALVVSLIAYFADPDGIAWVVAPIIAYVVTCILCGFIILVCMVPFRHWHYFNFSKDVNKPLLMEYYGTVHRPKAIVRKGRKIKCIVYSISVLLASTTSYFAYLIGGWVWVTGAITFLVSAAILGSIATWCFIPRKYWFFYMRPMYPEPLDQIGNSYGPTSSSYQASYDHINQIGHWNNDVTNPSYKDRFR